MTAMLTMALALCASLLWTAQSFIMPSAVPVQRQTSNKVRTATKNLHLATPLSKTAVAPLAMAAGEGSQYWEGDWVCADCGYIYNQDDCGGLYFEEQERGFKCPQCRGPRRRFAKKVGDKIGITGDGGDAPILLFSFVGFAATVAFGFWFAGQ